MHLLKPIVRLAYNPLDSRKPFQLFDIPIAVLTDLIPTSFRLGGLDTGSWDINQSLVPTDWHPSTANALGIVNNASPGIYCVQGGTNIVRLSERSITIAERLFPFTWKQFEIGVSLQLESVSFSPVCPILERESKLPISLTVYRIRNSSLVPQSFSIMQTVACHWDGADPIATFDFQHDRLALTGSLGDPAQERRLGLSLPDFHSDGRTLQGIEPFHFESELKELLDEFGESGELEPRVSRSCPVGMAAWVKVTLEPDEIFEAPFAFVWHDPIQADGKARPYTEYLGRTRSDNAVVWIAEQAFEDFGTEAATYRYWLQRIWDWQIKQLSVGTSLGEINSLSSRVS